jgi:hypothetical protein
MKNQTRQDVVVHVGGSQIIMPQVSLVSLTKQWQDHYLT